MQHKHTHTRQSLPPSGNSCRNVRNNLPDHCWRSGLSVGGRVVGARGRKSSPLDDVNGNILRDLGQIRARSLPICPPPSLPRSAHSYVMLSFPEEGKLGRHWLFCFVVRGSFFPGTQRTQLSERKRALPRNGNHQGVERRFGIDFWAQFFLAVPGASWAG